MSEADQVKAQQDGRLKQLRQELRRERARRRRAEAALAEVQERFRLLTETTGDALYRLRYDSMTYEYLSPGIERLTGYTVAEINRLSFASLVQAITSPSAGELERGEIARRRRAGQTGEYHADYLIRTKDGSPRWLADHSFPWLDDQGRVLGSVGILTDITERKELEERLRDLATTDHLTGAFNRRHFLDMTEKEVLRCHRYGLPFCLLILDIDHFKRVNDTHGHAVGDQVLKDLARTIQARLRGTDIFGRIGGEEFAVTLVESNLTRAARVAERLREVVHALAVHTPRGEVRVTISVGMAQVAADEGLTSLLQRADQALYQAKHKGRDRVELAVAP